MESGVKPQMIIADYVSQWPTEGAIHNKQRPGGSIVLG